MSYRAGYREVVTPAVDHWSYRPSRTQLAAIIDHLQKAGWIRRGEETASGSPLHIHPTKIASTITSTPEERCLTLYLEGSPSGSNDGEWPEDQLEFTPDFCEDVCIIDSPNPLILPRGDYGLALPCSSCGEDLVPTLSTESTGGESALAAEHGLDPAPAKCPSCGAALAHSEMAFTSAEERIDEVPFFRFGLVLTAILPRPEPLMYVDPALLEALQRICEIPFRSTVIDV